MLWGGSNDLCFNTVLVKRLASVWLLLDERIHSNRDKRHLTIVMGYVDVRIRVHFWFLSRLLQLQQLVLNLRDDLAPKMQRETARRTDEHADEVILTGLDRFLR